MKKGLLILTLMLAGNAFSADFSLGIQIGPPPPVRVEHRLRAPGPDYVWVEGYWYPDGHRYVWHKGYWSRPPYAGATWLAPHYDGHRYYEGHWNGSRGDWGHDHRWDHERDRDYHDHDRDHHDH